MKFRKFGVEYGLDGKRWIIDVMAVDEADAMRRLQRAASFGVTRGRLVASVPMWGGGLFVPFIVRLRNWYVRLVS